MQSAEIAASVPESRSRNFGDDEWLLVHIGCGAETILGIATASAKLLSFL
jgi:hypothetical protein